MHDAPRLLDQLRRRSLGVVIWYATFGVAWIVFSDLVAEWLVAAGLVSPAIQTLKGLFFVLATSAVLFIVLWIRDAALSQTEFFYKRALESTPALIWLARDPQHRDWFGSRWLQLTGRSLAAESGRGWIDGVHPDDRDALLGVLDRARLMHTAYRVEYRLRDAGGSYRKILEQALPRDGEPGGGDSYVGLCSETDRELFLGLREPLIPTENASIFPASVGDSLSPGLRASVRLLCTLEGEVLEAWSGQAAGELGVLTKRGHLNQILPDWGMARYLSWGARTDIPGLTLCFSSTFGHDVRLLQCQILLDTGRRDRVVVLVMDRSEYEEASPASDFDRALPIAPGDSAQMDRVYRAFVRSIKELSPLFSRVALYRLRGSEWQLLAGRAVDLPDDARADLRKSVRDNDPLAPVEGTGALSECLVIPVLCKPDIIVGLVSNLPEGFTLHTGVAGLIQWLVKPVGLAERLAQGQRSVLAAAQRTLQTWGGAATAARLAALGQLPERPDSSEDWLEQIGLGDAPLDDLVRQELLTHAGTKSVALLSDLPTDAIYPDHIQAAMVMGLRWVLQTRVPDSENPSIQLVLRDDDGQLEAMVYDDFHGSDEALASLEFRTVRDRIRLSGGYIELTQEENVARRVRILFPDVKSQTKTGR